MSARRSPQLVAERLSASRYHVHTVDQPIAGTAVLSLTDAALVEVDAIDHRRLTSLLVDLSEPLGRAVTEAWIDGGAIAVERSVDDPETELSDLPVPAGSTAELLGRAAICAEFAIFDDAAQYGLWVAQMVEALVAAERVSPNLRTDHRDLDDIAVNALEAALLAAGDDVEAADRVRMTASNLLDSGVASDLAERLGRIHGQDDRELVGAGLTFRGAIALPADDRTRSRSETNRPAVLPVLLRTQIPASIRLGLRSRMIVISEPPSFTLTITAIDAFPQQGSTHPVRAYLRARGAKADPPSAWHIDEARLRFDPERHTATAMLQLSEERLEGANLVLCDIPDERDPPPPAAIFALGVVHQELVRARLLHLCRMPDEEVEQCWTNAFEAATLLVPRARRRATAAARRSIMTDADLNFIRLATLNRLSPG